MKGKQLIEAMKKLRAAALEYANAVDEEDFKSEFAPEFLQDADDFAYEINSFVDDELEGLEQSEEKVPA